MSKNFDKVKGFYDAGLWALYIIGNVVDRWITEGEFREITGKEYEKE